MHFSRIRSVSAANGDLSAGPGHSVTVGDDYSIIRDTITISQPPGFEGDVNLIQSELSKLSTIGTVTVTPTSAVPDEFGQCAWDVTFESKAGDVPSLDVARGGTDDFGTMAELEAAEPGHGDGRRRARHLGPRRGRCIYQSNFQKAQYIVFESENKFSNPKISLRKNER